MALLPISDNNPLGQIQSAYVTWVVIGTCGFVFLVQLGLSDQEEFVFIHAFGTIPAVLFGEVQLLPRIEYIPAWATLLSSMFLHGGFMHFVGNMLFLWVLGDNVEDALGHKRYILFYIGCGIFAAITHGMTDISSRAPMIGASGAISGVIGAYLVLYPKALIKTLVWFFIIELPAWLVLGIWVIFQFLSALMASGGIDGIVAWWAHVGGLTAGLVMIAPVRKKILASLDKRPDLLNPRAPRIYMRPGPWKRHP